uniref:Coiled-coil SMC6 And NSE5 INteracting (CANIN) domain-containing protein n=1 Tax=Prolemur simus TaxID=1328070 RepID=A0A8C9DTA9_PROSS
MQVPGDMFPTDWSPPPIEFLNPRVLQELEQEPPDSLEQLFCNMAGLCQQAMAPEVDVHASVSKCLPLCLPSLALPLQPPFHSPLRPQLLATPPQMLLEKYSLPQQVIPPVHPGETVFLPRSHPLPCILDSSHIKPRNHLEGLFLSSPLAQQLSLLRSGLLSTLYLHVPDCPVPLLQWLFQLLTWPPETSLGAFGLLWDLSVDGLFCQSDEDMHLWYPSLPEVIEAFHSLGAHIPALYPLGPFQHGSRVLGSEAGLSGNEQQDTPQEVALDISLSYIYKFLMLCALAQPGAYPDGSLVGLIELLCRTSLDVGLRLLPKADLQQLLLLLLENIQEWPGKLQQLCRTLSQVSDHHHNLLALVQLFLDVTSRSRWVQLLLLPRHSSPWGPAWIQDPPQQPQKTSLSLCCPG